MSSRLRCVPFNQPNFIAQVAAACGAPPDWLPGDQVRYLVSYLLHCPQRPQTIVVEAPYVDRHYSEEYGGYYATIFRRHDPHGARLHLFSRSLNDAGFGSLIRDAAAARTTHTLESELQAAYLGFVGVRPLPSAPIGRTILVPYRDKGSRVYEVASQVNDVHIAGLTLRAQGLPFQQQDRGVGACATTALWSALARVMRADGGRPATPLAVTIAATRHFVTGRALPAEAGLDLNQTLAAVQHYGYSPYLLKPGERFADFQLALKCYLRSGIPVMLRLRLEDTEVHAVTLVGYREADAEEPFPDIEIEGSGGTLRSRGMRKVYVHDDRFGPYARMDWWVPPPKRKGRGKKQAVIAETPRLKFDPYDKGFESFAAPARIEIGIVPLYPKLRLTADDLVALAGELLPALRVLARKSHEHLLRVEPFFMLSGRYLGQLYAMEDLTPERIERVVTSMHLSRYVGVLRFFLGDRFFVDVVCDTTDILRETPPWGSVLAVLPAFEEHREALRAYARSKSPSSESVVF